MLPPDDSKKEKSTEQDNDPNGYDLMSDGFVDEERVTVEEARRVADQIVTRREEIHDHIEDDAVEKQSARGHVVNEKTFPP